MSLLLAESSLRGNFQSARALPFIRCPMKKQSVFIYPIFSARWLSIREMKCDSLVFSGYFDGRIDDYVSFLQWNTTTGKVTIFLSPSLHNTLTLTNSLIVERNIYRFIDMIGLILLFLSWFMIHRGANSAYTRLSGITVRKSRKVRRDLRAVYP